MHKLLIVDDEQDARENIERVIKRSSLSVVTFQASSIDEALLLLRAHKIDVLLLDIHLNKGTGFDLLAELKDISFHVIFITAFDNYAIKAFKFHAFDYLLKPIDPDELVASLESLLHKIESPTSQYVGLSSDYLDPEKISIPFKTGYIYLPVRDVVYLEADGSYTMIYTNERSYLVSKKLKYFENYLEGYHFCRIHASYIINLSRLVRFSKSDGGKVELDNGKELSVSRSRRNDLLKAIGQNK